MITSVPISPQRQRQRGYNQSALIAFALGLAIKVPFLPNALTRTRDTASQVNLSAVERKRNVEGAFRGHKHIVKGKNILIIDDVVTTGATLEACSHALMDAGAKNVYAVTVARAGLGTDTMDYN